MNGYIDIEFERDPSQLSKRYVEEEDYQGKSVRIGEWVDKGKGLWALRIPKPATRIGHIDTAIKLLSKFNTGPSMVDKEYRQLIDMAIFHIQKARN